MLIAPCFVYLMKRKNRRHRDYTIEFIIPNQTGGYVHHRNVITTMTDMISPLIQDAITAAVRAVTNDLKVSVVDEMVKSNEELQQLVKDQSDIINSQSQKIEKQQKLYSTGVQVSQN